MNTDQFPTSLDPHSCDVKRRVLTVAGKKLPPAPVGADCAERTRINMVQLHQTFFSTREVRSSVSSPEDDALCSSSSSEFVASSVLVSLSRENDLCFLLSCL